MKLSARNVLKGKVVQVQVGAVNAEVTIDIGKGVKVVSVVTKGSVESLGLKKGKPAYAIIKASNVLIGIDSEE
jgi:molybdate transport system regulatory protein